MSNALPASASASGHRSVRRFSGRYRRQALCFAKGRQIDALTPAGVLGDQHREMAARHHKELIDPSQFGLSLLPETLRSTASVPFGERYIGGSTEGTPRSLSRFHERALADPVENPIQIGRVS